MMQIEKIDLNLRSIKVFNVITAKNLLKYISQNL